MNEPWRLIRTPDGYILSPGHHIPPEQAQRIKNLWQEWKDSAPDGLLVLADPLEFIDTLGESVVLGELVKA